MALNLAHYQSSVTRAIAKKDLKLARLALDVIRSRWGMEMMNKTIRDQNLQLHGFNPEYPKPGTYLLFSVVREFMAEGLPHLLQIARCETHQTARFLCEAGNRAFSDTNYYIVEMSRQTITGIYYGDKFAGTPTFQKTPQDIVDVTY